MPSRTQPAARPRHATRGLKARFRAWIAARTPRSVGPVRITRQRVYIVPTRHGYGFGLLLLTLLLGAMNYGNSMAFALTFLLAGLGLLAMHHTHANLAGLGIEALPAEPAHAGTAVGFRFRLQAAGGLARPGLIAAWDPDDPAVDPASATAVVIDVAAGAAAELQLPLHAAQRGRLPAPRLSIATDYPLGLFHAWSWVSLDTEALVWPTPAAPGPRPPALADAAAGESEPGPTGQDSFAGLRPHQAGDSLRAIDWKSLARQPPGLAVPQVKQFADAAADSHWLDWQQLPAAWPVEQRLSQLCRWVLDAEQAGRVYGLRLPGLSLAPAVGASQRERALRALALFAA